MQYESVNWFQHANLILIVETLFELLSILQLLDYYYFKIYKNYYFHSFTKRIGLNLNTILVYIADVKI